MSRQEAPPRPAPGRVARWYRESLVGHPVGRDFRRLWAGDTVSQLGTQVGGIALPLLAVSVLGADELEMGLLATFENIAFLLVGLPAGAWVDRLLKRGVLDHRATWSGPSRCSRSRWPTSWTC